LKGNLLSELDRVTGNKYYCYRPIEMIPDLIELSQSAVVLS